jgi:hypothetical protein
MNDPVTSLAAGAILAAAALFCPIAAPAAEPAPVVVELFTSQGCNSCPPADALLGDLSRRADVLPLSFHVTYWDRLGWPDTFGLKASTERQRDYARALGLSGVYTPQMVIGGRLDVVGSSAPRVLRAIDLLESQGDPGPEVVVEDGKVRLGGGDQGPATIWLIAFDDAHDVAIARGENGGRTLRYHNVVRAIERLGTWDGSPLTLPLPLERLAGEGRDGVAVLVQRKADGAILAATHIKLMPG